MASGLLHACTRAAEHVALTAVGGGPEPIRIRQDFNALAVFAPSVPTDANGRAEVKVKLPDNLTRYRVMAVAVAGGNSLVPESRRSRHECH